MGAGAHGIERIHKGAYRNIHLSLPRGIQAVILAKRGNTKDQHKNWFIECGPLLNLCKINKRM